ncbi:DUF3152 domain-containing protein [Hamadaea sp. NPDC051192]|uniref:DUF3152 domain-containing protein n=1 Tax=Hamadaea sp. NPDC051192 TaxID=3154940 RepID=UPI0034471A88
MTDKSRAPALVLFAVVLLAFLGYAAGRARNPESASGVPVVEKSRSAAAPVVTVAARQTSGGPKSGTGKFVIAPGDGPMVGRGLVHAYQVAVETGAGLAAADFATAVEATLADPRSWTARGRWGFRRVGPGEPHDFVVKLATPATVDKICGAAGIQTSGEVSCRAGGNVVINLRRWLLAIPPYAGRLRDYQHLVVNHEVGHFLGFGHAGCPGRGRPAPAMMPQYYGLDGCVPNAWPYPQTH